MKYLLNFVVIGVILCITVCSLSPPLYIGKMCFFNKTDSALDMYIESKHVTSVDPRATACCTLIVTHHGGLSFLDSNKEWFVISKFDSIRNNKIYHHPFKIEARLDDSLMFRKVIYPSSPYNALSDTIFIHTLNQY